MTINISVVDLNRPEIKSGNLVIVSGEVVLITGDQYSLNFRGVVLYKDGAEMEKLFRICDAKPFSGIVTISNK